jgi:3,2-trans-enoyl-CoA isomerase
MTKIILKSIKDSFAVLTIKREPVNSMNLDLWEQLLEALDECEKDPKTRGIIITSGLQKSLFTAGNDLMELYAPKTSEKRYTKFWKTSNICLARIYESPLVTVAAIDGYCPAGYASN